jgi:dihydrolipoamide dehydrogenase
MTAPENRTLRAKAGPVRYDLAVVGSGQGGVPLALDFAKRGKRVVLFERGELGGCCVNVGCTPSKAFLASAHAAGRARRASDVHVHCDVRPDVPAIMERVRGIVGEWRDGVAKKFADCPQCEVVRAEASFDAPHVLRAGGTTYEADVVVLDTGSRAKAPELDGLAGTPYLTNENFFAQPTLPRTLIVLGSGYVGLELGQGAARLGSEVVIIAREDRVAGREEPDVSRVLETSFKRDGISLLTKRQTRAVAYDANARTFTLTLDDGSELSGDGLLVAVGRSPNIPAGSTDRAGIALDGAGTVRCDDFLQTSVAGHYALGDVAGQPQFTHVSWEDFRRLRAIIGGDRTRTRADRALGYAMYTEPQVGRVGITADQAAKAGIPHRVVTLALTEVARGPEWSLEDGFFRLVVDARTETILGATFAGYEAGELIHVIIAHMEAGSTWRVLERSVHIHPTFAEGLPTLARQLL